MEPRFNEVAGDWPNLFVTWRVRYIEVLFHTFYCNFGRDISRTSLNRGSLNRGSTVLLIIIIMIFDCGHNHSSPYPSLKSRYAFYKESPSLLGVCRRSLQMKCFTALERSLVPWIADSEVKFCPLCKKQFNVARRRHHCRLCGGIMCAKCSVFVSVSFSGKKDC